MSLPWISDPTPGDYLDAARDEWAAALAEVQATYSDAKIAEIVPGEPHLYKIEAEHEDYLLEFADADTGHLWRADVVTLWEVLVCDADGEQVHEATGPNLAALVGEMRVWLLARVEQDRVAQADDPDRDHDSREA